MFANQTFLIAGGDSRAAALARQLSGIGRMAVVGFDCPEDFSGEIVWHPTLSDVKDSPDVLILPIPVSRDGSTVWAPWSAEKLPVGHVLDLCRKDTLVVGGKFTPEIAGMCRERELTFTDLLEREDFAVLNALPTAEGALEKVLEGLPVTIHRLPVLITGYGKVARLCHHVFAGVGADVTVAARSSRDLAWAEAYGAKAVPLSEISTALPGCRVLLNTVPARILGKELLSLLPKDAFLLELASVPGGIDLEAAAELSLQATAAPGLPGQTAPEAAGAVIAKTICRILAERGNGHD